MKAQLAIGSTGDAREIERLAAGIIKEVSGAKWGRKWTAPEILAALDGYANRSGRRGR